jgi:hypothetical protein
LSKRQATDLLAECFAIPMAVSTVVNQQQVISAALAALVAALEPVVVLYSKLSDNSGMCQRSCLLGLKGSGSGWNALRGVKSTDSPRWPCSVCPDLAHQTAHTTPLSGSAACGECLRPTTPGR